MKHVRRQPGLYTGGCDAAAEASCRLQQIEETLKRSIAHKPRRGATPDRNWWTRRLDALLAATRRYAPPLHWLWVVAVALGFFIYAQLAAATVRLSVAGERRWPDVPSPCVLAMWHGCANSWLVVVARRKPRPPMAIMVARDPSGDCLALFCRLLGLRVVRGEGGERGWEALAELAREMARGCCAVITADGRGPSRVAKVGAVALASATGAPLMPVGTDCRPAIYERHKWDRVRTPLPFGRVAIALGQPRDYPALADLTPTEEARRRLQDALNEVAATAMRAIGMSAND
ncbi:MAG TPA: DUF374 domain-containing protein [Blastocatellia bacterium]|nr:DUF374 domain-containing protein [Blastocatellia bacterium]